MKCIYDIKYLNSRLSKAKTVFPTPSSENHLERRIPVISKASIFIIFSPLLIPVDLPTVQYIRGHSRKLSVNSPIRFSM